MRSYKATYRGYTITVHARDVWMARQIAAEEFKAHKTHNVSVELAPVDIERKAGWYVVSYWLDETTFTNKKFMDYEDAVAFAGSI